MDEVNERLTAEQVVRQMAENFRRALEGEPAAADLVDECARLAAENNLLVGAARAADTRLRDAGLRVGIVQGCDTPEAMADRIEVLEAENERLRIEAGTAQSWKTLAEWSSEEIEKLRLALRPFAEYADLRGKDMPDDTKIDGLIYCHGPTLGDCRRAREALKGADAGPGGPAGNVSDPESEGRTP